LKAPVSRIDASTAEGGAITGRTERSYAGEGGQWWRGKGLWTVPNRFAVREKTLMTD
jgi:hypothetical protein